MNFQAVSVGEKIVAGGYLNNGTTFSGPLQLALDFVNNSIGQFVTALNSAGLTDSTQIIITAKHGQSAKNRTLDHRIPELGSSGSLVGFVDAHDAQPVASDTADDVGLLWWQNPATGPGNVVAALNADPNTATSCRSSTSTPARSSTACSGPPTPQATTWTPARGCRTW